MHDLAAIARSLLLLGWLVLLGWGGPARAAPRLPVDYSIRRWVSSEQLPLSTVEAMAQTRDGFIWFAMNGGLGRFDGQALEVFNAANTPELPVPVITAVLEDRDGSLWVGSAGGGLVRRRDGRFERFGAGQGLLNEQVKALNLGPDGRLWIGTDGGGVFVREPDGTFRQWGQREGLEDPFVIGLKTDRSGQLVVLTFRLGPFVLRGERFVRLSLEPVPPDGRDLSLTQTGGGRIWLGTSGGVYFFDGTNFVHWAEASKLPGVTPLMAWETSTNEVWLGTDRSLVHWQAGAWATYPTGGAVSPRMANAFLADHEGSVWLSSEGGGLLQLRPTPMVTLGVPEGLSGNEVTSVLVARDGALWVGTTQGLTREDARGRRQFGPADGLADACVFSLQEDSEGKVWVSTRRGGIGRWDGNRFVRMPGSGRRNAEVVWCLHRGRGDTMWAGTSRGLIEYRGGQFVRAIDGDDGLSNNDVRCVLEQEDGTLWVGTSYGLNRITPDGVQTYAVTGAKEPIEVVVTLHLDADGALWLGTMARGLFRFHAGKFHRFSTDDGLPDNAIHAIVEDSEGRLWLASGSGLAVVARRELVARTMRPEFPLNIRTFRRADGLRSEEFTGTIQPTVARSADGRLWFATGDGLASVAPGRLERRRGAPRVSLERVAVEGPEPVTGLLGRGNSAGHHRLPPTSEFGHAPAPAGRRRAVFASQGLAEIQIPPQQERLDFQFVCPSFVAPQAVDYRFRLGGFDRDWVEAGSRRAAYYTRVPPGRYHFEVEARDETGTWSRPGAALGIVVEPAWWQRLPVRLVGAGLVLGSGVLFYQVRMRKLRRQREASAEFSRQLIRSQDQERARIAGELHDGLGQELQLIRNRAEIALRHGTTAAELDRQLSSISETAARAIQGVRALSRGLRPPELDQLGLTEALRWLGRNCAESAPQRIEYRVDDMDDALSTDQEVDFYRVAQEALNNAVKHSGATEITFEVQWVESGVQLSVFDNGRGFDVEDTESRPRAGSGLRNMQARAALLRGSLELHGEPGVGTRLTLLVPVPDKCPAKP